MFACKRRTVRVVCRGCRWRRRASHAMRMIPNTSTSSPSSMTAIQASPRAKCQDSVRLIYEQRRCCDFRPPLFLFRPLSGPQVTDARFPWMTIDDGELLTSPPRARQGVEIARTGGAGHFSPATGAFAPEVAALCAASGRVLRRLWVRSGPVAFPCGVQRWPGSPFFSFAACPVQIGKPCASRPVRGATLSITSISHQRCAAIHLHLHRKGSTAVHLHHDCRPLASIRLPQPSQSTSLGHRAELVDPPACLVPLTHEHPTLAAPQAIESARLPAQPTNLETC